jgi:hypothetical protein
MGFKIVKPVAFIVLPFTPFTVKIFMSQRTQQRAVTTFWSPRPNNAATLTTTDFLSYLPHRHTSLAVRSLLRNAKRIL